MENAMHPTGGRTRGIGHSPMKATTSIAMHHGEQKGLRPLAPIDVNRNGCMQQSSQRKGNAPKKVSIVEKSSSSGNINASKSEPYTPTVIEETRKTPDGKVTAHRYLRGKMLGKGGFAKVYLCTALDTNKNYAIKIVPKANLVKARARQKLQAEIKIHRTLKHKYICEYKHFFEDRHNCYILLELCDLQSMNELIRRRKKLTEPEVQYYMLQLIDGTMYMHSNNVIHRDLKLGNLFLNKDLVMKIGDLGLATKLTSAEDRRKTICGTPNYIAPEIINGKNGGNGHSFEVDIWSMGVILYTLLVGKPPYESKDVKATYQRILRNEYSFPSHASISEEAKILIGAMLKSNPADRPTLEVVRAHCFFTKAGAVIPDSLSTVCSQQKPTWEFNEHGSLVATFASHPGAVVPKRIASSKQPTPAPLARPGPACAGNMPVCSNRQLGRGHSTSKFIVYHDTARPDSKGDCPDAESEMTANAAKISIRDKAPSQLDTKEREQKSSKAPPRELQPLTSDAQPLQLIHDSLSNFIGEVNRSKLESELKPIAAPEENKIWVTRYVDYTSKYGLGFLLSNGSAGVYFNDSTKAVLAPDANKFHYVQRCKVNQQHAKQCTDMPCESHTLDAYPEDLKKKVTLLKHFCGYLHEQETSNAGSDVIPTTSYGLGILPRNVEPVYLKKWVRTRHAVFFRLSNGMIQVVFFDHSEVLLSPDAKELTYVDKVRRRQTMKLNAEAGAPTAETLKRLKYTKDILHQLLYPAKI